MRFRDKLLTGAGVGLAAGLAAGVALDGGLAIPLYACLGGLLGLLSGAYLEASERAPFWAATSLVCAAPLTLPLGSLLGASALADVPALLALPLICLLLRRREARELLVANALTFAVAVAVAVGLLALLTHPSGPAIPTVLATLTPLVAFALGMTLHTRPPAALDPASEGEEDADLASVAAGGDLRAQLLPLLGWLMAGAGLLLAFSIDLAGLLPNGSALLQANRAALANTLALLVVVALCWDSSRAYWSALLGQPSRWRGWALGAGGAVAFVAVGAAFAVLGSRSALVGLGLTLLAVYALRRAITTFALLAAAGLPLLALFGNGSVWLSLRLSALGQAFSPDAWRQALAAAASGPFGAALPTGSRLAAAPRTLPLDTLRSAGFPGLMALFAVLGVTVYESWRAYRTLRANDAETGIALAAGGTALFLLLGGLTSDAWSGAPAALLFWLLLGCANTVFTRIGVQRVASGAPDRDLRGHPLRVVYVAVGDEAGETPPALLEAFRTVDRDQITPLLISYGDGFLARRAPDVDVMTRTVPSHDAAGLDLATTWAASRVGALRRLGGTRLGSWICARSDTLGNVVASAREWRQVARATLELRPDLVVSASPATHLPALLAGRLAGARVLWHARDVAPPQLRRLQNALLGWTAGVLAPSQTAAGDYRFWLAGALSGRVRVLRPGVALPEPLTEEGRHELRLALGVPHASPLLAVVGPIAPTGGYQALLESLPLLRRHYPDLHVVIATEGVAAGVGVRPETSPASLDGEQWLRGAVTAAELDACVTQLGARSDVASLLAAADVAVFPTQDAPMSRSLSLALAQGTPIVAANAGALAEQVAEAWGCELCAPGDAWSLAHAVETVVERLARYRLAARRNPGLIREWGSARLEQARLLSIYREICMPATRLRAPWRRTRAANFPERWLAALWAGVGARDDEKIEPEREDLAAVAASVAPAAVQTWASMGA